MKQVKSSYVFTCDGCGSVVHTESARSPENWYYVTLEGRGAYSFVLHNKHKERVLELTSDLNFCKIKCFLRYVRHLVIERPKIEIALDGQEGTNG